MKRTRLLCTGLLCAVLAALLIAPVSAHGCHGGGGRGHHGGRQAQSVPASISVCPYEDCVQVGRHLHDDVTYCGYAHCDGICDGACRALCPLEECTVTGRHFHGTICYCGSEHSIGFCDNSCAVRTSHGRGHC